ncbi:MAG: hypothetical protein JST30_15565 [Armatimonadetes bacterium]|nr:hypothetical protein [Armatimonadota bacterium]
MLVTAALTMTAMSMTKGQDPSSAPPIKGMPYLSIQRVEQIDNLDKGDALGKNRADFYAIVTVNGVRTQTQVLATDDGRPDWNIPLDYSKRVSRITVRLMDDDGGLEAKDDHADICPKAHRKDLTFTYDRGTGRLSGDVRGRLNRSVVSEGLGDDDRARITFVVRKTR